MKTRTQPEIGQVFGRVMFVMIWAALAVGTAWGQQGSCVVSQIQLSIGTGGVEEVMVGNLDIEVHLTNGIQKAQVIGAVWLDNTTNTVPIQLNQPVGVSEIKSIKMTYTSAPGFEQWLMSSFNAAASGKGVIANIATSGPYQFNWTTTVFEINTVAAPCRPGGIEGPVYVAPGVPVESRQRLTNDDVVRMARAEVPESAIIAKINASPTQFDLSQEKMLALHRQGVSTHVLNFMAIAAIRQGKGGGKSADDLNPQPYPPKGTLLTPGGQQTMLGTQASAPASPGSKSSLIIAVQPPPITDGTMSDGSVRPGTAGSLGQSQTMSATGNVGNSRMIAPSHNIAPSGSLSGDGPTLTRGGGNTTGISRTVASSQTVTPPALPSERPAASSAVQYQPPSGNSVPSAVAVRPPYQGINPQVAAACGTDATLRILSVSTNAGSSSKASRPNYGQRIGGSSILFRAGQQYTILGCSFGADNPDNAVYLSDGSTFTWFLEKISWTNNSVTVAVQSLDQAAIQGFEKAYGGPQVSNLMLFVLGQNGNTKLNGVALSIN